MDVQSLVAAHMPDRRSHMPMAAAAEDRYYSDQITLTCRSLRLLRSIAAIAGVILLLAGIAPQ